MKVSFCAFLGAVLLMTGCAVDQPVAGGKQKSRPDAPAQIKRAEAPKLKPTSKNESKPVAKTNADVSQVVVAETKPPEKDVETQSKLLVTSENSLVGIVAAFNAPGRFVVLDFPVGKMPAMDQKMFIYRQGLKVGEVKITGPERDHNTVADLIYGEARKGDEVREN